MKKEIYLKIVLLSCIYLMIQVLNHRAIRCISIFCFQVADLICRKFDDIVGIYRIVDCRYPFEFEGGHIQVRNKMIILQYRCTGGHIHCTCKKHNDNIVVQMYKTCLFVSKTLFLNLIFILERCFPICIILFSQKNILF